MACYLIFPGLARMCSNARKVSAIPARPVILLRHFCHPLTSCPPRPFPDTRRVNTIGASIFVSSRFDRVSRLLYDLVPFYAIYKKNSPRWLVNFLSSRSHPRPLLSDLVYISPTIAITRRIQPKGKINSSLK